MVLRGLSYLIPIGYKREHNILDYRETGNTSVSKLSPDMVFTMLLVSLSISILIEYPVCLGICNITKKSAIGSWETELLAISTIRYLLRPFPNTPSSKTEHIKKSLIHILLTHLPSPFPHILCSSLPIKPLLCSETFSSPPGGTSSATNSSPSSTSPAWPSVLPAACSSSSTSWTNSATIATIPM